MWKVALRPRWIAALLLALGVAAGFAALAQWQVQRSIDTGIVVERPTETAVPLASVTTPQGPTGAAADGQRVTTGGEFVEGDWLVVHDRYNGGVHGWWVVGHLAVVDQHGTSGLVVAVGWTGRQADAERIAADLNSGALESGLDEAFEGRYHGSEGPQDSDYQAGRLTTVAPSAFINLWHGVDPAGVYGGYLVATEAVPGLDVIDSPPPLTDIEMNWLNVFYAVEWVIFAGFAVYLWWRLVRDEFEKERDTAKVD